MFARISLFTLLISSATYSAASQTHVSSRSPNFIVIMADDCSAREIGCYGNMQHKTPHLDQLARTGVMFRTCWATPICSPSRAEIMTGRYAYRTLWYHNNMKPGPDEPGGNLSKNNLIFAQLLKSAGYATGIAGKWQLYGTQKEYGFDEACMWESNPGEEFDGPVEGKGASLPDRAARYWHPSIVRNGQQIETGPDDYGPDLFTDFINDFVRRHKDSPFLVYYPMVLTHKSWDFDLKKNTWIPAPELDADGRKTRRKTKDTLKSNVEYMDHVVGRIVENLDELGIRQKTIVMFTADNGTSGSGKMSVSQERGPRVPMIVNGPGLIKPLGAVDALTDFSDVLPTLGDLAGVALPQGYPLDGRSIAPVLLGQKQHVRDWIFCAFADKRLIRDPRWLLDGDARLWDCGQRRDEQNYRDVTESNQPEVLDARQCFATILEALPGPDPGDPLLKKWQQRKGERPARPRAQRPDDTAKQIIETAEVKGGLVVHLGCGNGRLTAALRMTDAYRVHGLDHDPVNIDRARRYLRERGLYGYVSVEQWEDKTLPYVDNLANLVVTENPGNVSEEEILRILVPNGVACVKKDGKWTTTIKPRPAEMDEWTHALHGADNNAVASDTLVGPPQRMQWVAEPRRARQHEHLASVSVVVSADGRVFSIQDEGTTASVLLPAKWFLVARDAFNGLLLWKQPIALWEGHLSSFRSGPPALSRRLVAVGKRVYVTLGYGQPVTALDAATGKLVRTYEETEDTLEIVYSQGILFLVLGDTDTAEAASAARRHGASPPAHNKRVLTVQSDTGQTLWQKQDPDTVQLMPVTLAVSGDRVFFHNTRQILCLDARTGQEHWRTDRPIRSDRPTWSTPTLVVLDEAVLSADRATTDEIENEPARKHPLSWIDSPTGELIAFSAKTGERLWSCPCREGFHSSVDVLVADGLVWTGEVAAADDPGITVGRDPLTGEIKRRRPTDQVFYQVGMPHHRCHRNRATERYIVLGRAGVEFVDLASGQGIANHWVRGTCQYGVLPCNGLLYIPPHSCACYLEAKMNGFLALSSQQEPGSVARCAPEGGRLEHGPAFQELDSHKTTTGNQDNWPTYRHNAARSSFTDSTIPAALRPDWATDVGGRLSSITISDGRVFVASIDEHTVSSLDAENGNILWRFTAAGRIDSPPTIANGRALFGSADGWVYCLRATDGQMIWRFLAAPEPRRVMAFGQLESPWPVHGSVLVQDDVVSFAAGRSSYLDGGIYLYRLDVNTGEKLSQTCINSRDPKTGYQRKGVVEGFDVPGALPDVLSGDDEFLYMRQLKFDRQGIVQAETSPHLFCPTGLLDDTWWHRSYWIYGTRFYNGYRDWFRAGREVPAGRLLVFDRSSVYGFGLKPDYYYWSTPLEYHLYATSKQPEIVDSPQKRNRVPDWGNRQIRYQWSRDLPLQVRAMVLADRTLFVAGPPSFLNEKQSMQTLPEPATHAALSEQNAALQGRKGAMLWAISALDGKEVAAIDIDAPPVWDGMAAAEGGLYLSTVDGKVRCFAGR